MTKQNSLKVLFVLANSQILQKKQESHMSFPAHVTYMLWLVPGPLGQSKTQILWEKKNKKPTTQNPDELSQ
jgi:hypothetical protein